MKRWVPLLICCLIAQVGAAAESPDARLTNVTPQPIRSGPHESYFLSLPTGLVIADMELDITLEQIFRGSAFVVIDETTGKATRSLLGPQQRTDLNFTLGLDNRFEVALNVPLINRQESEFVGFGLGDTPSATGLGDMSARGTWRHLKQGKYPINLGTSLLLTLPTGDATAYTSRGNVMMELRETASLRIQSFLVGGSVGVHYQPERNIVNQDDGTRVLAGVAATYLVRTQQTDHRVTLELDTYAPVITQKSDQFGALFGLGYQFSLREQWQFGTVFHGALTDSFGLPSFQALVSIGYRYLHHRRPPRCINDRSYLFDDRCDPPDSDGDGIFDPKDRCINEAEDKDGFEDADGCPDPDNDQDGLFDVQDNCPNDPEDRDDFEDEDGCPDPDNDNDGFLDPQDKCPNEPETKNGFDDDDGCPEPDDDNDGIPNANDNCPAEPEDKDGFEDTDGCPDPDNDGDGILDAKDLCPNEAENFNEVRDEDGCPDEILAVKTDKEIVITDEIRFKHGQVIPKKQSRGILSAVAKILIDNPTLNVQIEGHTDGYGGAQFNRYLSQARAQAVLDAIARIGGESANLKLRLSAVGYGKDMPAASNETKAGRALNRRVIFRIISQ